MAISFRRNLAQFPTNTISAGCDSSRSSAIAQSSVATPVRTPEIEKTSYLRVRIHAHHIHVASQLLALRTRDVAGLIHVLDHAQLDAVAFALDLLGLLLRFGADAHIRTRPQRGFAASVVQQQAGAVLGVVRVSAHLLIQSVDHMFDRDPPAPHAYARTAHRR